MQLRERLNLALHPFTLLGPRTTEHNEKTRLVKRIKDEARQGVCRRQLILVTKEPAQAVAPLWCLQFFGDGCTF